MNEKELKELNIEEVEASLNNTPYGQLNNEFRKLGIEVDRKKHSKKTDLIKACLMQLVALKQAIGDSVGHTQGAKPIKTEKEKGKSQNTPNQNQNDLTANAQNLLSKPGLENLLEKPDQKKPDLSKPDLKNPDPQKPVLKNEISKPDSNKDLKAKLSARSTDPSKKEVKKENEISKKPEIKTETGKPIYVKGQIPKYSKEVLEKNLATLDANLKRSTPNQRLILLKKREELDLMLSFYK